MTKLNKAQKENRLDKQLQHLAQYKLLIIDEIGYLPVDHQGSNLLFQLIAKRYMTKSTIVTTNMPFSRWGEVFSDNTLASAVLDRLLHYSHIIRITGNFYKIKDMYPRYLFTMDLLQQRRDGIKHLNIVDFIYNNKDLQ